MAVATIQREPTPQYPAIKPGMMGMYIFLASEVMFFGSLFAMYFYLVGSHPTWPPVPPSSTPEYYVSWWWIPFFNTIWLLSSGVTAHFGLEGLSHDRRRQFFILWTSTILLVLILYRAGRGQFSSRNHVGPGAVTLYWHFVDVVWVFLFGILYLGITAAR